MLKQFYLSYTRRYICYSTIADVLVTMMGERIIWFMSCIVHIRALELNDTIEYSARRDI